MATHQLHMEKNTTYFITFTCYKWLCLFEVAGAYPAFYKWFEYLRSNFAFLVGYVIMPNHFHGLVFIDDRCPKDVNKLVSNGKRFVAYDIIARLKNKGEMDLLMQLEQPVTVKKFQKGQVHECFIPSFDAKECFDEKMLVTKLNYMHQNPVRGKWQLVEDYVDYPYSSAAFYERGIADKYVVHYKEFYG